MDIRDFRIGDIVQTQAEKHSNILYVVCGIHDGYVSIYELRENENYTTELKFDYICPVPITDDILLQFGATYNALTDEYKIAINNESTICIKRQGKQYIASYLNKYRPPFAKMCYLHELQHFVWDTSRQDLF